MLFSFQGPRDRFFETASSGSVGRYQAWAYSSVGLERTPDKREVGGSSPPRPTSSDDATRMWGCSSVGRAPALQAGCRRFDSDQLHQDFSRDLESRRGGEAVRPTKHSDNRIRRVTKASHSEVCCGVWTRGVWISALNAAPLERELGRPEFGVTKLLRACGGCLGDRRRGRTWVAAKSVGEPLTRL